MNIRNRLKYHVKVNRRADLPDAAGARSARDPARRDARDCALSLMGKGANTRAALHVTQQGEPAAGAGSTS